MKNGIAYTLLAAVLFVTLEPVSKLIVGAVNPYAITLWRFLIGTIFLLPPAIIKLKKEDIYISFKDLGGMTLLGLLFICISMLTLQLAVEKATNPSLIAVIFSANSIFSILFSRFFNKERLNTNRTIALVLGVVGIIILCTDFTSGTSLSSIIFAIFAALTFSLYTILGSRYSKKFGGIIQTAVAFLTGSIILLTVLLVAGVDISLPFEAKTLSVLCYLGFLVTGLGYLLYFKAMEKGGTIMASLTFFIKPVLTPFATFFVNGIMPNGRIFAAVVCIVTASYFAAYRKQGFCSSQTSQPWCLLTSLRRKKRGITGKTCNAKQERGAAASLSCRNMGYKN